MNDYLTKPIRPEELVAALRRSPSAAAPGRVSARPVVSDGDAGSIDVAALRRFATSMGTDEQTFVEEMIDEFLRDGPEVIGSLEGALAGGDAVGVRRAAHTLKSNANTFGAHELGSLCAELEVVAKDGDLGTASVMVTGITDAFARVAVDLPLAWRRLATV